MHCGACHYHKADVEAAEHKEPAKYAFEVSGKDDLSVRVVRSSEGSIKIPHVGSLEPGPNAEGFITNIEGVIERFKKMRALNCTNPYDLGLDGYMWKKFIISTRSHLIAKMF